MPYDMLIRNCRLYTAADAGDNTDIAVCDGVIADIGEGFDVGSAVVIDAGGRMVIPGLIDIHIQGAGGADVLDGSPEALKTMSAALARLGTTGFLATTVMSPKQKDAHLAVASARVGADLGGASLIGIHLEGPFINPDERRAISPDAVYAPSTPALDHIFEMTGGSLSMMTVAPELDGARDIVAALVSNGVIASFGHSHATYEQTLSGFMAGITHVTHMFNAMPSLHHHNPGPIPAILETPNVTIQLVSDGVHVHEAVVRTLHRAAGAGRIACITDGAQAMGLPDGRYVYNGREYESRDGTARYLDGTLIGSALGLKDVMLRYAAFTGCSFAEAVESVTAVPAYVLGIDNRKGSIETGKDADMVILDDDFSVFATIVEGKARYIR